MDTDTSGEEEEDDKNYVNEEDIPCDETAIVTHIPTAGPVAGGGNNPLSDEDTQSESSEEEVEEKSRWMEEIRDSDITPHTMAKLMADHCIQWKENSKIQIVRGVMTCVSKMFFAKCMFAYSGCVEDMRSLDHYNLVKLEAPFLHGFDPDGDKKDTYTLDKNGNKVKRENEVVCRMTLQELMSTLYGIEWHVFSDVFRPQYTQEWWEQIVDLMNEVIRRAFYLANNDLSLNVLDMREYVTSWKVNFDVTNGTGYEGEVDVEIYRSSDEEGADDEDVSSASEEEEEADEEVKDLKSLVARIQKNHPSTTEAYEAMQRSKEAKKITKEQARLSKRLQRLKERSKVRAAAVSKKRSKTPKRPANTLKRRRGTNVSSDEEDGESTMTEEEPEEEEAKEEEGELGPDGKQKEKKKSLAGNWISKEDAEKKRIKEEKKREAECVLEKGALNERWVFDMDTVVTHFMQFAYRHDTDPTPTPVYPPMDLTHFRGWLFDKCKNLPDFTIKEARRFWFEDIMMVASYYRVFRRRSPFDERPKARGIIVDKNEVLYMKGQCKNKAEVLNPHAPTVERRISTDALFRFQAQTLNTRTNPNFFPHVFRKNVMEVDGPLCIYRDAIRNTWVVYFSHAVRFSLPSFSAAFIFMRKRMREQNMSPMKGEINLASWDKHFEAPVDLMSRR